MKVKIEIETNTFIRFWLVIAGLGLAGYAIFMARTPLTLTVIALFLALALHAPVQYIAQRFPGKSRLGATSAAFLGIVLFLGVFTYLVVPPIIQQTAKLVDTIPGLVEESQKNFTFLGSLIDRYHLEPEVDKAVSSLRDKAGGWAAQLGSNVFTGIGSIFNSVVASMLVLVTAFLMLLEGPTWLRRFWLMYTDERKKLHHKQLAHKMHGVMVGYVNGQLAIAAIAGASAGIFVFILSFFIRELPANLALPTMAIGGVLSLIPMFGATIAGILITLMLALNSVAAGIAFLIYFVVYQQIENNFVSPTIQSKTVDLSALVVIIAVSIGTYVFGLAGGIISIPIAGWVKVLVEDYFDQKRNERVRVKVRKKPLEKIISAAKKSA